MYIPPGRYRHYKGNLYEVIGSARHSETEEWLVIYRALYGDFGLWARPAMLFTGTVEQDGRTVPRFEYLEKVGLEPGPDQSTMPTTTEAERPDDSNDGSLIDTPLQVITTMDQEIGHEVLEAEKVIHERYEWLHIANDYTSALLFLVGSIMFLWPSLETPAIWLFIVGSAVFLNGPFLRTLNKHYVKHLRKDPIHW